MLYRDERGVRIEGTENRREDFVAKRHVIAYADSMDDAQQFLRDTPCKWGLTQSRDNPKSKTWDLDCGYDKALELAKDGWHEGVEMIDEALQAIVPSSGREARWGWGVTGGSVSIGRYLTGHPKTMRNRRKKQMGAAPVLHIIVNTVASCAVHGKQMANYGAAITGLIDRLENMGKRVHLDCVMTTHQVVSGTRDKVRVSVGWNVKRASEPVDLSQVAFSLAHPAALRRMGFAMMERTPKELAGPGYGRCVDALPCDVPDFTEGTMIVDGVNHEYTRCNTPTDALRLAIEQLNKAAVLAGHATPDQPLIDEEDWLAELQD